MRASFLFFALLCLITGIVIIVFAFLGAGIICAVIGIIMIVGSGPLFKLGLSGGKEEEPLSPLPM